MAEKGWKRSTIHLVKGLTGLYTENDGPQVEVTVEDVILTSPQTTKYKLLDATGQTIQVSELDRFEDWNFYTRITPVPFVPKRGGKKRTTRRKRSKKQK